MAHLIIGCVASVVILINAVFAKLPGYRIAPIFLIPLVWVAFALRRKLQMTPLAYALLAAAIVLHDLGAYGFYQHSPTPPISFDIYVHFYFAFAGTFVLHGALQHHPPWRPWQVMLATLLFVMGVGAIHEIMEFSTYLVLGEERGMLKTTGYRFDNERDLMSNLCGVLLALLIIAVIRAFRTRTAPRSE